MRGGNQSLCEDNSYGLDCLWSGNPYGNQTNGWCYQDNSAVDCSSINVEKTCMDTYYCWWLYSDLNNPNQGGNCSEPQWGTGDFVGQGGGILNDWNPGCYIFDYNQTECNSILGCNFTNGVCDEISNPIGVNITADGIKCSYINDSSICNDIPALSTCCIWQNGTCENNKYSSSCISQLAQTPDGEDSCEDAESKSSCETIAGSPWFMPCSWNNETSKCGFKVDDIFGTGSQSLIKIENQRNCEAAGGKWISENYCEGNISVPTGRCEYKFDEEDNCDKACFACEIKDSNGNQINSTNAESACAGSSLGICEFVSNSNAPNEIGFCSARLEFKTGVAQDCDTSCGACTFKGDSSSNDTTKRPSYYCSQSKANSDDGGCKWITDDSSLDGGYCLEKGDKTCEDSCDRCKSRDDCSNDGRTSVANQSGSCKWQGSDNDGSCVANIAGDVEICWNAQDDDDDNLIDCSDPGCYSDSFCGFVSGDCFGWTDNNTCISNDCEWVVDAWGSWCDFKGTQCWKYDGSADTCLGTNNVSQEVLNITTARVSYNNVNQSKSFSLVNSGGGWVIGSINITNSSGYQIGEGNYTIDYNLMKINFTNTTYMVSQGGAGNYTNVSYRYYASTNSNCKWESGTGSGWCEKDWSIAETCFNYKNESTCGGSCVWTNDTWCNGNGAETDWCLTQGGWCEHEDFVSNNCWENIDSSTCTIENGCSWKTDQWSTPHCEVNWSGNCWNNINQPSCESAGCWWNTNGNWCSNSIDECWQSTSQSTCNAISSKCSWNTWSNTCQPLCFNETLNNNQNLCTTVSGCIWKAEGGWCEDQQAVSCFNDTNSNSQANCQATQGCKWRNPGWCSPQDGFSTGSTSGGGGKGGSSGAECFKYDGNEALCIDKSAINISCGWTSNFNPSCEPDWSKDCWIYTDIASGCNATNGCWWNPDSNWCGNLAEQCWSNLTLVNDPAACNLNPYCNATSYGCEPTCFSRTSSSSCSSAQDSVCRWITGWCNSAGMNDVFSGIEAGAPTPIGMDLCDGSETSQLSVDICGFGMKDMGNAYGFGANVKDFSNASSCNKEKVSNFMTQMELIGNGIDTVNLIVYLDTDGSSTGGCTLSHNNSAQGYEFKLRYASEWNVNTSKASETFTSYECENNDWKLTDIKLSVWKKIMCSEVGGPMLAIEKSELSRYPDLYDSTQDMRIYVATIGNIGNTSSPTDVASPGWFTPGAVDFEIMSAFDYGADSAKFENILKNGFVQGEDCFTALDDDSDGNTNCNDWDCQYSPSCSDEGVNADDYQDTGMPQITGVKVEEYPDSALVIFDTNKPSNGTLEFYGNDSRCTVLNSTVHDIGITSSDVRDYKLWHTAEVYSNTIGYNLINDTKYYYKLKICDSNDKCATSKCTSFVTSTPGKCGYCNFVSRIKTTTSWIVNYDTNQDGVFEHEQGLVCGPNAGMKSNYTDGRKVNIRLTKSDNTTYFDFLNASLTKTGLNDKVRTISSVGDIITGLNLVGLSSETRDKIINNLHPEVCLIKIPNSGSCTTLYHCDDEGENCEDRTAESSLVDSTNCVWKVPNCEFSTYTTTQGGGGNNNNGGGGSSGGGSSGGITPLANQTTKTTPTPALGSTDTDEDGDQPASQPKDEGAPTIPPKTSGGKFFVLIGVVILGLIAVVIILSVISRLRVKRKKHMSYGY